MRQFTMLVAVLLLAATGLAQVTVGPMVMPRKQFFDVNGNPLAGGHVCTYTVGTTTPQVTYTDYTASVPNAICDPIPVPPIGGIILDAGGYASIYMRCTDSPYKVVLYDRFGVLQWSEDGVQYPGCTSGAAPHELLSTTHTDTDPYTPPEIGDIIRGSAGHLWERYGIGSLGYVLTVASSGGSLLPEWRPGAAGPCTDLSQVTDLYVSTAGSDVTGDGTVGTPWATVQHAIDEGIPGIVCGRYVIHLAAGTYNGANVLAGRIFAGGTTDMDSGFNDWPYRIGSPTAKYSWVTILGDTAAPANYVLQVSSGVGADNSLAVIALAQAYLTLRGVTLNKGGFGAIVTNRSVLQLAGVIFHNNLIGLDCSFDSRVHADHTDYGTVNNDGQTVASILLDNAYIFQGGFNFHDEGYLDDSDYINTGGASGTLIAFDSTGATTPPPWAFRFQNVPGGHWWGGITCTLDGSTSCLHLWNSSPAIEDVTATGATSPNVPAIKLVSSSLRNEESAAVGITLTNWDVGVQMSGNSTMDALPGFTGVTAPWQFLAPNVHTTFSSQTIHGAMVTKKDTVDFSATPDFDMRLGGYKKMTLTNDVTSSTIAAGYVYDGQDVTFQICQDGAGLHSFAWPTNVLGADTIGTTASKCNTQTFRYDSTAAKWYAITPMVKNQ